MVLGFVQAHIHIQVGSFVLVGSGLCWFDLQFALQYVYQFVVLLMQNLCVSFGFKDLSCDLVIQPVLRALPAETKVDGLPRASSYGN